MATSKRTDLKTVSSSRKSDKRRSEIMRVAIETINARSYAQATMVDIAAALDLRDAALYHYFHDKRTLAYACHCASLTRAEALLDEAAKAGGRGADLLQHFILRMLSDSSDNGPLLYLGDISYLETAQRKAIAQWLNRLKDKLKSFLVQGMKDGSITQCEPELVVELLVGMLIWLGKWASSLPDITVERIMNAIHAFGFQGLLAKDAGVTTKKQKKLKSKKLEGKKT